MALSPPERLRELLADARSAGVKFPDAWPVAVGEVLGSISDREAWSVAFAATRSAWRSAFEGTGHRIDLDPGEQHRDEPRPRVVS